jgi:hypothetical protein
MSPIDSILGLPGVQVLRVERWKSIHVWVQPRCHFHSKNPHFFRSNFPQF